MHREPVVTVVILSLPVVMHNALNCAHRYQHCGLDVASFLWPCRRVIRLNFILLIQEWNVLELPWLGWFSLEGNRGQQRIRMRVSVV